MTDNNKVFMLLNFNLTYLNDTIFFEKQKRKIVRASLQSIRNE